MLGEVIVRRVDLLRRVIEMSPPRELAGPDAICACDGAVGAVDDERWEEADGLRRDMTSFDDPGVPGGCFVFVLLPPYIHHPSTSPALFQQSTTVPRTAESLFGPYPSWAGRTRSSRACRSANSSSVSEPSWNQSPLTGRAGTSTLALS